MLDHIDVVLLLTLNKKQYKLSDNLLISALYTQYGYWDERYTELVTNPANMPKTYQIVQRMRELGYSPGYISEYLTISKQAVSQHLAKDTKKQYINPFIYNLERPRN